MRNLIMSKRLEVLNESSFCGDFSLFVRLNVMALRKEEGEIPLSDPVKRVNFHFISIKFTLRRQVWFIHSNDWRRAYNVRIDGCPLHTWGGKERSAAFNFWNIHNRLPKTIMAQTRVSNDFPSLNSCDEVISDEISFKPSGSEYWCCVKGQSCHVDTDLSDVLVDN